MIHKKLIRFAKKVLGLTPPQLTINLAKMAKQYNMKITGAVIVGAHEFREYPEYRKLGVQRYILIEPDGESYAALTRKFSRVWNMTMHKIACGSQHGEATMFQETANDGQSNSLLKPKNHLRLHPEIRFHQVTKVKVCPLSAIVYSPEYNFLSIDVQGFELEVLKGAERTLKYIDYILCEVNAIGAEVYEGATDIIQIRKFLEDRGFHSVQIVWAKNQAYGDSLWIRKSLLPVRND